MVQVYKFTEQKLSQDVENKLVVTGRGAGDGSDKRGDWN